MTGSDRLRGLPRRSYLDTTVDARGPCSPPPPLLRRAWGRRRRGLRLAMAASPWHPAAPAPHAWWTRCTELDQAGTPAQGAGPRRAACWCPGELRRRAAGGVRAAPPPRPPQDPAATRGSAAASPWPQPMASGVRGGPPWGRAELGEGGREGDGSGGERGERGKRER